MSIKDILYEIKAESSTNKKMVLLKKYVDNETLKLVLYLTLSKRVNFYIKKIPVYTSKGVTMTLEEALDSLSVLSNREKTGHDGIAHLTSILESLSSDDAYVIERVIEKKIKFDMGSTNVNKVFTKLIEKTFYMGCKSFDERYCKEMFEDNDYAISEVKEDGRYCKAIIDNGVLNMISRQGEETAIGDCRLVREIVDFPNGVYDGELLLDGIHREKANGLFTSIINITTKLKSEDPKDHVKAQKSIDKLLKKDGHIYSELLEKIRFVVWDVITVEEYFNNLCEKHRKDRLGELEEIINNQNTNVVRVCEYKIVNSYEEAISHFVEILERGGEGTVLKTIDGIWKDGKRWNQIKMKVEYHLDLRIVSLNYGNKGTKNEHVISVVCCESEDGLLTANAQGLTEQQMIDITEDQENTIGKILQIKCNGLSSNSKGGNSVLYPVYDIIRDDKDIANTFPECQEIDRAAKGLKEIVEANK